MTKYKFIYLFIYKYTGASKVNTLLNTLGKSLMENFSFLCGERWLKHMKLFWQFMIDFLANKSATASQVIALPHSVPAKLKNSIFEIPIITQTLNINNLRATSAKSFNLHTVRKLVEYSFKNVRQRQCLLLPFSRYSCPKVGR